MYSAQVYRGRKLNPAVLRRFAGPLPLLALSILLLLALMPSLAYYCVGLAGGIPGYVISRCMNDPLGVLQKTMPAMYLLEEDVVSSRLPQLVKKALKSAVGTESYQPLALLKSQLPGEINMDLSQVVERVDDERSIEPVAEVGERVSAPLSGECLVGIYNTHTGETYIYTDGIPRLDGKRGGVVTVAAALQETLQIKYGIRTTRSDKVHDTTYSNSYLESEKTAREILAANPELKVLLDLHRDAGKTREQSLVNVNGREVAPILFIVGSDARLPFPEWRKNYAFAVELSSKMDQMYPGLSLGVRVKDGRYNQYLHPGALLVEVGTTNNSTEEAILSAVMLADVLAMNLIGKESMNIHSGSSE